MVGGGDAAVEEADFLTRYAREGLRDPPARRASARRRSSRSGCSPTRRSRSSGTRSPRQSAATSSGLMTGIDISRRRRRTRRARSTPTGCFVFVGFRPNTGIIGGHFEHDEMGYVKTDTIMQTSIPGLFAAGDLRSQLTRQVTTAVGDATTAAIAVEKYLKARAEGGHAVEPHGQRRIRGREDRRPHGRRLPGELLPRHRRGDAAAPCSIDPGDDGDALVEHGAALGRARSRRSGSRMPTSTTSAAIAEVRRALRRARAPASARPAVLRAAVGAGGARCTACRSSSPTAPDRELADGDVLACGALAFTVMHVPGHAPGHVSFNGHGVALAGDLLFAGSHRAHRPAALRSVRDGCVARPASRRAARRRRSCIPATAAHDHRRASCATNPFLSGRARALEAVTLRAMPARVLERRCCSRRGSAPRCSSSAVVAPAAFAVLPTRTLAGALVGRVLPVLFWCGMLVGVGVAVLGVARRPARGWRDGRGPHRRRGVRGGAARRRAAHRRAARADRRRRGRARPPPIRAASPSGGCTASASPGSGWPAWPRSWRSRCHPPSHCPEHAMSEEPRIPRLAVDDAPDAVRPTFDAFVRQRGKVPNLFRVAAHARPSPRSSPRSTPR